MIEMEFDQMLSDRMRDMVSGRRLPDDFSDRLAKSVKGAKTAWRIKVAAVTALAVVAGVIITGFTHGGREERSQEPMLVVDEAPSSTTEVSGWFLLGYLRECFKRNKNGRRKEEE